MKAVLLCCMLVTGAFGQHRGFGRGGFVGGGFRVGGFHSRGFASHRSFVYPRFGYRGFIGTPVFGFGAYWGGFDVPYVYPAFPRPPAVIYSYPVEPVAPVVITQRFAAPYREYTESSPSRYEPVLYLIALKNHTIYAAVAYWVDGETLHYITREREHKQTPLESVDREFTQQLNRDRRVEIRLPPVD